MNSLSQYAVSLVEHAGRKLASGEVFAKVLTTNDDSGRHGVLIPSDAYSFFPHFEIVDPKKNQTLEFSGIDALSGATAGFAYKYYERYPERRITRLHKLLNDAVSAPRLLVCLRAKHTDGSSAYYFDCANSAPSGRFSKLFTLIFGREIPPEPGAFVVRPIDTSTFAIDATLQELLGRFDEVHKRGWVDSLREGDTGIGYTFETLIGVKENNDKKADFNGIEIKCKRAKEAGGASSGKINLFQAGPVWTLKSTAKERIRILGYPGKNGLYACRSQVTTTPNNRGVLLAVMPPVSKIDLKKHASALGYWTFESLGIRLAEKHSRTAFIKAQVKETKTKQRFFYEEFVYCDKPSIERFVDLVAHRKVVFEFLMSEEPDGRVRNRGYPWRLIREELRDQLFAFQIRLR